MFDSSIKNSLPNNHLDKIRNCNKNSFNKINFMIYLYSTKIYEEKKSNLASAKHRSKIKQYSD